MSDLDNRELAQLGLKHIEDAVVALLSRHGQGMRLAEIADALGLRSDLGDDKRNLIAAGVLELLVTSGRIVWDEHAGRYRDNPDMV
jgi:hypothetical protein